jgi:hypothetical protein
MKTIPIPAKSPIVVVSRCPGVRLAVLTTLSTEDLIPPDHPIRRLRVMVDAVLDELDDMFASFDTSAETATEPGPR